MKRNGAGIESLFNAWGSRLPETGVHSGVGVGSICVEVTEGTGVSEGGGGEITGVKATC